MTQIAYPVETEANQTAVRFHLRQGQSDPIQILQFLEVAKSRYSRMPMVREFTIKLLTGLSDNDILGQINRVVKFVRENVTYVRDPLNAEYVVSPINLLNSYLFNGYMAGDCDDHVMLMNSMLGSVGIQTKFVGVKWGDSPAFNHVISGVFIKGKIYLVDPCAKGPDQPVYRETLMV